jgi:hypothetical protein
MKSSRDPVGCIVHREDDSLWRTSFVGSAISLSFGHEGVLKNTVVSGGQEGCTCHLSRSNLVTEEVDKASKKGMRTFAQACGLWERLARDYNQIVSKGPSD